jgi:RNAse (barnase) inhibitor barstar
MSITTMKTKKVIVDLKGVKSKVDLFGRFAKELNIKDENLANWDAFDDDLSALHFEDSEITNIHLVVKNSNDVLKDMSRKEYSLLMETLAEATEKAERIDGYIFSFELSSGPS